MFTESLVLISIVRHNIVPLTILMLLVGRQCDMPLLQQEVKALTSLVNIELIFVRVLLGECPSERDDSCCQILARRTSL